MIITLVFLAIILLFIIASFFDVSWLGGALLFSIILALILIGSWGASYNSYLDMRIFYDTNQIVYKNAINSYIKNVNIPNLPSIAENKYQGFQKSLSDMITDYKNNILYYNKLFLSKKYMSDNIIYSWLIIQNDKDMKLIKFSLGDK